MIDDYTRLLEVAAESEDAAVEEAAVSSLVAHLKSAGRMKMLSQIVRRLRLVAARRHAMRPLVEAAHEKDAAGALRQAAIAGISAKHAVINPSLISGWRARENGKLVDHSAKRALLDIYQNVVTH